MTIVLAEDEDLIRYLMIETLEAEGYDVAEAANSTMALEIIRKLAEPPSILVTDFHMPGGINGFELAARMRAIWPRLPVVIVSGQPEVFKSWWQRDLGYRLIRKPYRPSQLLAAVSSLTSSCRHSAHTAPDMAIAC